MNAAVSTVNPSPALKPASGRPSEYRQVARALARLLSTDSLKLPMPPQVAMEAMRMCADEHVSFADLDALVRSDPALVAHLLRTANSPAHCPGREITSLRQAMMFLGIDTLRQLLMHAVAESYLLKGLPAQELEYERTHAVAVARAAHALAKACGTDHVHAFMAGMLHDVGRLVAPQLIERIDTREHPGMAEALIDELHAKVGAHVVSTWQLPRAIRDAIALHHDGEGAPLPARIIIAAERLALHAGLGAARECGDPSVPIAEDPIWSTLPMVKSFVPGFIEQTLAVLRDEA